jgi:hypothetical protein
VGSRLNIYFLIGFFFIKIENPSTGRSHMRGKDYKSYTNRYKGIKLHKINLIKLLKNNQSTNKALKCYSKKITKNTPIKVPNS